MIQVTYISFLLWFSIRPATRRIKAFLVSASGRNIGRCTRFHSSSNITRHTQR